MENYNIGLSDKKEKPILDEAIKLDKNPINDDLSSLTYEDLAKKYPEKAIGIAIEKLSSHNMSGDGLAVAHLVIMGKGWDYFVEKALNLDYKNEGIDSSSYVLMAIRECMHVYGNPEDLPIEKIEKLLQFTNNDVEYMMIKSLVDLRRRVENLEGVSLHELLSLADNCEVDYWDEEVVRKEAEEIMYANPEEYYGLLEEMYAGVEDMHDQEEAEYQLRRWQKMTIKELLEDIYPAFSFNIATKYNDDAKIVSEFILEEGEVKDKLKKLAQKNTKLFYHALSRQEMMDKLPDMIEDSFNQYNIIPALGEFAEEQGAVDNDRKFGYAVNSTLTPIAKDTLMLHSPTGRMLAMIDSNQKMEKKFDNTKHILRMAHFMSHKNQLFERQYSQRDLAMAASLCFWEIIPNGIRKGLEKSFEYCGIDKEELEALIRKISGRDFESLIGIATEYSPVAYPELSNDMSTYIANELKERCNNRSPHFVGSEEYLGSVNAVHGKTSVSESQVNHDIAMLNYPTIKYLEKSLNLDLSLLSRKEFFALITFLKTKKDGEGFENINNLVGRMEDPKNKTNRVKSFLSLLQDTGMGEKILRIGEGLDSTIADAIFAKYAELIDMAQDTAQYLAAQFGSTNQMHIQEVTSHLLRRGKALLNIVAEDNVVDSKYVLEKINKIQVETEIFKNSFAIIKRDSGGEFSFENIKAIQTRLKTGPELSQEKEVIEKMKEIYLKNYEAFPEEFKRKVIEGLEAKLRNEKSKFYSIYHNGKIIAFNSFTPLEDGTVHFANFNVDPTYSSSKLGEAMMEASLDNEAKHATIVAEAVPGLPITETYLNKKDFQKTGEVEVAGVKLWQIRREKGE